MKLGVFPAFCGAVLGLANQVPFGPVGFPGSSPAAGSASRPPGRPNIVFILTDDQDLHLDSLSYMPHVHRYFREGGTTFARHYCTTAICCPSRVSLWTGKQAHNTNVTDVRPPHGGYPKFVAQGLNDAYLPVWLQAAGYGTYYTGKLFNAHSVVNYDRPAPKGWTAADFLLDPNTYRYRNATFQRTGETPRSYPDAYLGDILADKARGLLREAAAQDAPFFLGIAPIAPHANVEINYDADTRRDARGSAAASTRVRFTEPIPANRHAHLFADARVPRTPHFNPDVPSGAAWVRRLAQLAPDNVAANDHYYRQRLRALQSVDELVDAVFADLAALHLLANTFVFYTTDNGYHIGQHRLQPGKQCGYEEDVHIPLFVYGPGVRPGAVFDGVTTHVDLTPTLLQLAGAAAAGPDDLDGEPIPLTGTGRDGSRVDSGNGDRHEHVTIEFWGNSFSEGDYPYDTPDSVADDSGRIANNTYKAVRIVGDVYNLYYAVWCSGEHELYDLATDPYQMANLLGDPSPRAAHPIPSLPYALSKIVARLDALLLVLKSCRGRACVRPWDQLHPATPGSVRSLRDALAAHYDAFYGALPRVVFDRCGNGYILDAEGPGFDSGLAFRDGAAWHEWV